MKTVLSLVSLLALAMAVSADVYMHAPRGMNNRCDEQNNNRNNNNRLFNSQNNAAGGYAVAPSMYYYAGSVLTFEWTNQHSCGDNGKTNCEFIWQYSCADEYKDGTSDDPTGDNNGNTCTNEINAGNQDDTNVGRHEPQTYFDNCNARDRNTNLFAAAENVNNNNGAQATRQNQGGGTSGFECQEERDYYPYWHPTPFVDIAVLTTNTSRCAWYQDQSENVVGRNYCTAPQYNNEPECEANGGTWELAPPHRAGNLRSIGAPDCQAPMWSRDNHLGSTNDGYMQNYNWTVPADINDVCFLRVRYNISTADYDPWNIDAGSNGDASPVQDDPYVVLGDMPVRLAIDTNQFGRTFEDRSYVFEIRSAPVVNGGLLTDVYNMGVRGKRGNIAQVRNCMEYDFTPQRLRASVGDFVHIQWTGSNHNPAGNAGEGRNRWDRHNIVQLIANDLAANYPQLPDLQTLFSSAEEAYKQTFIGQAENVQCKTLAELEAANDDQATDNCAKLNGNPTGYWDGGMQRFNKSGIYNFMSTRNNNFSNRGQKGTWVVGAFNRRILVFVGILGAIALVGLGGAGIFFMASGGGGAAAYANFKNKRASFGSRRSMGSGRSGKSGRSHGSHRSKGSFGASMI
jgi:plastocyanin